MRPSRSRTGVAFVIALSALALAFASSTQAAVSCDGRALSKPFAPWLDYFDYFIAPGGDFESRAAGWKLAGGAATVAGNEPFHVGGPGATSLSLPRGGSATSPSFCAGLAYPTVRLFSKGGGLLGMIAVDVLYTDGAGLLRSQSLGTVLPSGSWRPSLPVLTMAGLPLLTGSQLALRLRAAGGSFTIDDVYVDPRGRY